MGYGSWLDRFAGSLLVVSVGVIVCGTDACQEDYDFAKQSNVPRDSTTTPEGTGTPTGTATATPTVTGSVTAGTPTTPVATTTATPTQDPEEASGGDLFNELSALSAKSNLTPAVAAGPAAAAGAAGAAAGNWLGEAFSKDGEDEWLDSDADGFSEKLEEKAGTDPQRADSAPTGIATTKLESRMRPEEVEAAVQRVGDDAVSEDGEAPLDSDEDGVPDVIEDARGMNARAADTDGDGLRDDRELALGSNPLRSDTDGDGISDNREYMLGSDPITPETKS